MRVPDRGKWSGYVTWYPKKQEIHDNGWDVSLQ